MNILKLLILIAGFLCVGLGTAGIFLPVLPTVPFYLLATYCFAKSSERFHRWFTGTGLYKKHLESFASSRSMAAKTKLAILLPVTLMLAFAAVMVDVLAMRIVIAALLLVKYWYFVFRIKTVKPRNGGSAPCAGEASAESPPAKPAAEE
ncbi:MAG: YbaN family protein [Spirochaetes bacterium]|nr:YbaN family protein [Spirochaetota bacterium]